MDEKWTKRGTGTCPECHKTYPTAWKPKTCPCGYELGGRYIPKPKKIKVENPECVFIRRKEGISIFSAKTSPKGDRCFVITEASGNFCHHPNCKDARGITMTSHLGHAAANFSCRHIKSIANATSAQQEFIVDRDAVDKYPCDQTMKRELMATIVENATLQGWPSVIQVATNVFVVCGPPSASSPIGYTHVVRFAADQYRCTSKSCKTLGYQGNGKQQKHCKICFHKHALLCALKSTVTTAMDLSSSLVHSPPSSAIAVSESLPNTISSSEAIQQATLKANGQRSLPYKIPVKWLDHAKLCDALTRSGAKEGGWPSAFHPDDEDCRLCGSPLGNSKQHPGSRGNSLLMTNGNPFWKCIIHVKSCTNKDCKAMHQLWPVEIGLFNICDKILIGIEVLLEWRELFKRGVPISTAIESKLDAWCEQCTKEMVPSATELNYLSRLLYNSFYFFEIITVRSLDDNICGLCGVIGEFYLGDGNEKNCCSLKGVNYDVNPDCDTSTLEEFLDSLKAAWHKKNVFAKGQDGDIEDINASTVPPIIAPALRGNEVFNTEMQKKSIYLKSRNKPTQGDPALLHKLISSKKLDMTSIEMLTMEDLQEIAKNCSMTIPSGASKSFVLAEINALYAHLLVGNSPCHGFNKVPGNTGGFYHIVCRHGVTVASKFLLLQESVRDAADLYLSFRYPPPLFICDTPCGLARHMDVREPNITEKLWADRVGCFEKPIIERGPSQVSIPDIVPLEYRTERVALPKPEDLLEWQHPLTGTTDRYIMGDRFHKSTEPHKSPLCEYHDLQCCKQAFTIKTSYQESENHRKNFLRLRSSTMQSFPVHFLYNYLMDYYHNENIITHQKKKIEKTLTANEFLSRDIYYRFVKMHVN